MSQLNLSDLSGVSDTSEDTKPNRFALLEPNVHDFEFATIENNDIVELSAVENEKTIWIRSTKYDEKYCELMSKINVHADPIFDEELVNGGILLMKYSGDFSRAIVLDKEEVYMQLMDIGTKIYADLSE